MSNITEYILSDEKIVTALGEARCKKIKKYANEYLSKNDELKLWIDVLNQLEKEIAVIHFMDSVD